MKRIWLAVLAVGLVVAGTMFYVRSTEGQSRETEMRLKNIDSQVKGTAEAEERGNRGGAAEKDPFQSTDGKIIHKELIRVNSPYQARTELYRIHYLSEGIQVVGFLCKPKEVKGKLPVIIFNRGGIVETSRIGEDTLKYFTKLSSHNYVVVASQYRGYAGSQGQKQIAGDDVQDVLNLIPLAESLPYVDPGKKVMLGFSRGGMMTFLAVKEGADIQAAAVVGGVTDLARLYEQQTVFQNPLSKTVGDPLLDAEEYKKRSAVEWAEEIRVPVLLLHGLNDRTVLPEHSVRLAEELEKLGYEHKLVLIPGGSHYLTSHEKERDREILSWFGRYLN